MALVFKLESGVNEQTANVGNSNFKEHYPEVNRSMAWLELTPYISQATDTYVIPYIGKPMYDDIVDAYQAGTLTDAKKLAVLNLLQRAVAYYTIMHAIPKKLGVIASMGAVTNSPAGGAVPISQWSYHNQLLSITKDADTFMDQAINLLTEQVIAANADFNLWKSHEAFTEGKADYFRLLKQFQKHHSINNSHRTFLALVPYIQKATKKYIIPILGKTQHAALVEAVAGDGGDAAQQELIEMVRNCLAEWSIYLAIPALTVVIEGDGIKVISNSDGMNSIANITSAFYKEAAKDHQYACEEAAKTFRADLIEFLFKNADDYPLWMESEFYANATTSSESGFCGDGSSVFI
jgi:hypothetical protein